MTEKNMRLIFSHFSHRRAKRHGKIWTAFPNVKGGMGYTKAVMANRTPTKP